MDRLIRDIIAARHEPDAEDVESIFVHIRDAPFRGRVRVPPRRRGIEYMRRRVERVDDSAFVHLVQRVVEDGQWSYGTTVRQYLSDLAEAVASPDAQLVLYGIAGENYAGVFAPNTVPSERLGRRFLPYVYVVYAADFGTLSSGYNVGGRNSMEVGDDPRWYRRP